MKRTTKNTTLDDIASVIGFSATLRMSAWLAGDDPQGAHVFIPENMPEDHFLSRLLGHSVAKKLSQEWPAEILDVSSLAQLRQLRQARTIARMVELGESMRGIARTTSLSKRRVEQTVAELTAAGLLREKPKAKRESAFSLEKDPQENPLYFFPTTEPGEST